MVLVNASIGLNDEGWLSSEGSDGRWTRKWLAKVWVDGRTSGRLYATKLSRRWQEHSLNDKVEDGQWQDSYEHGWRVNGDYENGCYRSKGSEEGNSKIHIKDGVTYVYFSEFQRCFKQFYINFIYKGLPMSREKRFSIRPIGFVSKKDIGARSNLYV